MATRRHCQSVIITSCLLSGLSGCSGEASTTSTTGGGGAGSTGDTSAVSSSSAASSSSASGTSSSSSGSGGQTSSSSGGSAGSGGSGGSAGSGGSGGAGGGSSAQSVVKFVAIGDVGKGNQGQYDVAEAIAQKCAADGCDFVQLLGDNIYDSGVSSTTDSQWQTKFEMPYASVNLPFWVVLGNHDYGGEGAGFDFARGKNEIDYTKVSTKWKLPSAYYKHTEKHVDFFALDTNLAMYFLTAEQKTDVAGWVAASNAQWKVAVGHHPYFSNGPHGNAGEYEGLPFVPIVNGAGVKDLLDYVVCGNVDLYIAGHDHNMQWIMPKCGGSTNLIVSGAGSSTSELKNNTSTYFETLDVGFVYIVIADNVLTAQFINTTGTVLHTRSITK